METIDSILENVQKEVELYGRSGSNCVFKDNLQFSIKAKDFVPPLNSHIDEAVSDVNWFLQCASKGFVVSHPSPDVSFWIRTFGEDALPYGSTWNFPALKENLLDEESWRRAILFNHQHPTAPPCVVCYQYQVVDYGTLDCTVTLRSSDVVNVLAQDVLMSRLILDYVCSLIGYEPGKMTFNLANAHVYYQDMEYPDEHLIEYGD